MKTLFLAPDDPRWEQALARFEHDVYHLPAYVAFAARHEQGTAGAILVENGSPVLLLPVLLRSLPETLAAPTTWCDATTPYGYPAPLLARGATAADAKEALVACLQQLVAIDVVSLFVRLHPLLDFPRGALDAVGAVVDHGRTVTVPLDREEAGLMQGLRSNHRRDVRKLGRRGFRTILDDWRYEESFRDLYQATMTRVGAGDYYYFDDAYFRGLRTALGQTLHLAAVLAANDEVAAAGMFTRHQGIIEYHLGGTAEAYLSAAPSKRMFYDLMCWGAAQGDRWLHLGGGVGGHEDSLFRFKQGFSQTTRPFATVRIVCHADRYQWLHEQRESLTSEKAATGFFPGYRQPLSAIREGGSHED